MNRKALFFDVDGTIVDSNDLHAQAWVDVFGQFGHDIAFNDVRFQIGKGGDNLIPALLSAEDADAQGEAMNAARSNLFKTEYIGKVVPFPDVLSLLQHATDDGWMIVLASSGAAEEVEHYQSLIGSNDLVDLVTTSDDAEKSKPNPDIFAAALAKAGIEASDAVVIGDTPYDMEAAGKLGIRCIAVRCGGFPDDSLMEAGALAIYDDPADLLNKYELSILAG